jgi:putative oxidoreductase
MIFENKCLRVSNWICSKIIFSGEHLQSLFLFYMRLVWGHQLFLIGLIKLHTIDEVANSFTTLNIPDPLLTAYLVAIFETIGGIGLFLGLASRFAALPVIVIMSSALHLAHPEAFTEFRFLFEPHLLVQQAPYPFLLTALLTFIFGPGRISIDAWIKRWASHQPKY